MGFGTFSKIRSCGIAENEIQLSGVATHKHWALEKAYEIIWMLNHGLNGDKKKGKVVGVL